MNIFFKIIKKNLKNFLTVFFSLCFLTTNSNADMFNKSEEVFYFEKYKTEEEARDKLLDLHPIGSDASKLLKTLEKVGCRCEIKEDSVNKVLGKNNLRYRWCAYDSKVLGHISIWIWNDESGYWSDSSNLLQNLVIHYREPARGSFIIHPILSAISAFNHVKSGFRFEKHKTADSAKEALLEAHPIGSKVNELVEALKKAGAKCSITDWKVNSKKIDPLSSIDSLNIKEKISKPEDGYICFYEEPELVFSTSWIVNVRVSFDNWDLIKEIEVNSTYNHL